LLFSSGYLAALGALDGLGRLYGDCYSDELNHASIIDGVRLSRMTRHVYPHGMLPPATMRAKPAAIVTESLFGMSGRIEDLDRIVADLGDDDVVLIDEAHALGVFGEGGSGFASRFADPRIVVLGTLSKAFGCGGGFIAGPAEFIEFLISTARSFIFDTSLPPPIARAARASLARIVRGGDLRERLFDNVAHASRSFTELGLGPLPTGPIASIVLGEPERALGVAATLRENGFYVPAIRPPTVPAGTSRLRVTFNAKHRRDDLDRLFAALARALPTPIAR
jgi:8-amino-7-oxononanoate synthase